MLSAGTICPVVFHRDGKPIRSFDDAWKKACGAAGAPGKVPHDFQRTAVRNLVRRRAGEDGHADHRPQDAADVRPLRHRDEQDLRPRCSEAGGRGRDKKGQSRDSGRFW